MKLFPFLFLNFSHGQEWCTVKRAAQLCNDDSDLQYRICLDGLGCQFSDHNGGPSSSHCTSDRKSVCWYEHQARKNSCPCGNGQDGCGSGNWCRGKSDSIMITREGDPELVTFSHVISPSGSEDHFRHDKITSGADDWNSKPYNNPHSCSFQLGDRMFIIGGEYANSSDNQELVFAPPQWIAKLEKLPNLPIPFVRGACYAYTSTDAMICSSSFIDGIGEKPYARVCYHTSDGITYKRTGDLMMDHRGGEMVKAPGGWGGAEGQDTVLMIGGLTSDWYMEEYNNGNWFIRKNQSAQQGGLGGITGFSAINVPYKHSVGQYQIYILGGYNNIEGSPNTDIWYWHSASTNYLAKMPATESLLTQRVNHATIQIENLIYFIGGYEYNNYGGTIEIWELKWDHDPAYVPSGYGACPHWCSWNDIEGLQERPGGLCTSAWWDLISSGQSQCTYYQDTPQFHKRLVTSTAHGGILEESYLKAFVMP